MDRDFRDFIADTYQHMRDTDDNCVFDKIFREIPDQIEGGFITISENALIYTYNLFKELGEEVKLEKFAECILLVGSNDDIEDNDKIIIDTMLKAFMISDDIGKIFPIIQGLIAEVVVQNNKSSLTSVTAYIPLSWFNSVRSLKRYLNIFKMLLLYVHLDTDTCDNEPCINIEWNYKHVCECLKQSRKHNDRIHSRDTKGAFISEESS